MDDNLKEYRAKRNFAITNEPKGDVKRTRESLRFSVQHHAARTDHYDLRLEYAGVALSWAVPKGPSYSTEDKRLAVRVEDHPVDYMAFEGVIPKGEYGGGTVMLWDEGTWTPKGDVERGLEDGSLKFTLNGERLKGDWALVRMRTEEKNETWLLIKERDRYAKRTAGIRKFSRGVRSGRTMSEIEGFGKKNPFRSAEVMLAVSTDALPKGKGYLYELKYDGHRTLGFIENGKATLQTRNRHDCTQAFRPAADALEKLLGERCAVVDGEMVVVNAQGVPDFGALQAYRKSGGDGLSFVLFDLLALDGKDLRALPLSERKEKLAALMQDAAAPLAYSAHTDTMSASQLSALKEKGLEGVVIKRADAPYTAGKNGDWMKLKFRCNEEFVIGGFLGREQFRSLLVGVYDDGDLLFWGCVGTGFSEETKRMLADSLRKRARESSPFANVPKKYARDAVWVTPSLVAQVAYAEITASGLLRQASFRGLRTDKSPSDVKKEGLAPKKSRGTDGESSKKKAPMSASDGKKEKSTACGVQITHPEKRMFPTLTKGALAAYYEAVSARMLPYLKDRALSLVCCPAGIDGEKFFRKHLDMPLQGVKFTEGEDAFFYVRSARGILALVQQNAVEFHIRGTKIGSERPDIMVFDLDPDEELPLADLRRGAREVKRVLEELGLVSFLKTSGGKGYHILVPFRESVREEAFKDTAKSICELLERRHPSLFTATMSKSVRKGKIFLDWQRNSRGATSAAPYSVRARAGAPVSMPIFWEELSRIAPASVTVERALKRLEQEDPWANFFAVKRTQSLR